MIKILLKKVIEKYSLVNTYVNVKISETKFFFLKILGLQYFEVAYLRNKRKIP